MLPHRHHELPYFRGVPLHALIWIALIHLILPTSSQIPENVQIVRICWDDAQYCNCPYWKRALTPKSTN